MRCLLLLIVLFCVSIFVAAGEPNEAAKKKEIEQLRGMWQVTKFADHGEQEAPAEEIKGFTLEFKEDSVTIRKRKGDEGRAQPYTVNPTKKPKWIDIGVRDGSPLGEGIYKINGDELTICIVASTNSEKPTPRPAEFKASKQRHSLLILKKVKA